MNFIEGRNLDEVLRDTTIPFDLRKLLAEIYSTRVKELIYTVSNIDLQVQVKSPP